MVYFDLRGSKTVAAPNEQYLKGVTGRFVKMCKNHVNSHISPSEKCVLDWFDGYEEDSIYAWVDKVIINSHIKQDSIVLCGILRLIRHLNFNKLHFETHKLLEAALNSDIYEVADNAIQVYKSLGTFYAAIILAGAVRKTMCSIDLTESATETVIDILSNHSK